MAKIIEAILLQTNAGQCGVSEPELPYLPATIVMAIPKYNTDYTTLSSDPTL